VDAYEFVNEARAALGLSVPALWVAYVGLGGSATLPGLQQYLDDGSGFTAREYDFVAQALNDSYIDRGGNHPVPYSETFRSRAQ